MLKNLLSRYLVYIAYFLGIGMVSSGIVLMPFNMVRYGIILAIGLILFSTGSFINEVILDKKQLSFKERIKLILVSLTLAIGIGMISGGIAHFKESPGYVAILIPIGIILSCVSFIIKNKFKLSKKEILIMITILIVIAFSANIGLTFGAQHLEIDQTGGDIFKMDM